MSVTYWAIQAQQYCHTQDVYKRQTLSNLPLNLEGKEKAVFVEQGTATQIPGTLAWRDGTQRPDTSVTSAEWIFAPDDVAYAKAEGSTAITVEPKELKVLAATRCV